MKHRQISALLVACVVVLPLLAAHAQSLYSPGSPVNTSSPYAGVSLPSSAPARQTQVPTGAPGAGYAALGSPLTGPQVMTSEPVDPNHKLGRGDELSYRVVEDREPDKIWPLYVTDDGNVDLPIGGRVKAAGKSTDQLRADIKGMLEREYYYHATVVMGLNRVAPRASRGQVFVIGAVKSIGPVDLPVDAPLTASQAIYLRGGPVDFSVMRKTRVLRKGGPKDGIRVNVSAVERGEFDKDVVLQPGDTVKVPEAGWGIRG